MTMDINLLREAVTVFSVLAFVESVKATYPFYAIRLAGGTLFLAGMLLMAWNVWKTAAGGRAVDAPIPATVRHSLVSAA